MSPQQFRFPALAALLLLLVCRRALAQRLYLSDPIQFNYTVQPGSTFPLTVHLDSHKQGITGVQFTVELQNGEYSPFRNTSSPPFFGSIPASDYASPLFPNALVSTSPELSSDVNPYSNAERVTVAIAGTTPQKESGVLFTLPIQIPAQVLPGSRYNFSFSGFGSGSIGQSISLGYQTEFTLVVAGTQTTPLPPPLPAPTLTAYPAGQSLFQFSNPRSLPGGTATLEVSVSPSLTDLNGFQAELDYDPSLTVHEEEIRQGGALPNATLAVNALTPGHLTVGIAGIQPGPSPASLLLIPFHLPSDAAIGTSYPVTIKNLDYARAAYGAVSLSASADPTMITVASDPDPEILPDAWVSLGSSYRSRSDAIVHFLLRGNPALGDVTGIAFTLKHAVRQPETVEDLQFVDDVIPASTLSDGMVTTNAEVPGQVTVSISGSSGSSSDGILADVPLLVPISSPKNSAYRLEVTDVTVTKGGKTYAAHGSNSLLIVTGRMKGDVSNLEGSDSGNGRVDVQDAIALLRIVIQDIGFPYTASQYEAADANCDERVQVSDVVTVLRMIAGLTTKICS